LADTRGNGYVADKLRMMMMMVDMAMILVSIANNNAVVHVENCFHIFFR